MNPLIGALVLAAVLVQDRPIPVFPVQTEAVYLDVAILEKHPRSLVKEDLTIYEDNRPQTLTYFSAQPTAMDIALLLDVSGSMQSMRQQILLAAGHLVDSLGADDRMEILRFGERVERIAPFSNDKQFLRSSLIPSAPQEKSILWEAIYTVLTKEMEKLPIDSEHPRRRVLVVLTDGMENNSRIDEEWLMGAVRKAQTAIFFVVVEPYVSPSADAQWERYRDEYRYLMTTIAKETGGALEVTSNFLFINDLMRRVTRQLAVSYTLGWVSDAPTNAKPWRALQVAVRGIPSDKLRHRSGYFARTKP